MVYLMGLMDTNRAEFYQFAVNLKKVCYCRFLGTSSTVEKRITLNCANTLEKAEWRKAYLLAVKALY